VRLRAGARPVSSPYSGNITLSTPGGTTVTVATASSTVAVKPITAVLNNTSPITKIYNGTDDATLVASNYGLNGLEVCDEVTVSGTASYSNKDFGIGKTVTAGNLVLAGIDAANYTLSNNTATTTGDITKRTVNVTAVANTKVYGSPDPELGYTFSPALLTGESFNGSLSRLAGEDVGDYDITMGSLAISNNYTIVLTTAKLSITPGALIVRADLKTKTYGDSDPSLTYTVIGASGTGNVFTGSLARTAGENVGSYSITQGTLAFNGNYQMRFESSELTIAPRPLLIKADNQSKYVGAANPALTFSYSGFKAGETNSVLSQQPEISTTATTASLAGSYDIIVGGAVAQNYAISYQQGILMINDINSAPTLNAIANQSVCAGVGEQQVALSGITAGREANQTVTLSISSSNAALFTSLAVSRGAGTIGTLSYRPAAGATGTATITITVKDNGGTDAGGVDTYTRSFTITINPLPVVTISSDKGLTVAKGETVHLTATGGTSYVWANASGIVSGQNTAILTVRPTANTSYTVTATSAAGCTSMQSITIQVTEEAVAAKPTNIMSPNGDGVNDKWVIENLDLYPNNSVVVVDRSGREVYSKKGYDNSWDATLRGLPLSEGTYYYIINYGDGKTPAKKGFITILNKR
jgi:gliding motility-associated-like protein